MQKMTPGDVLLFKPEDLQDDIIAFWTHGPYSHVGIAVTPDTFIQAVYPKILISEYIPSSAIKLVSGPVDLPTVKDAISWAMGVVGNPYSFWDVLDAGIAPFTTWYADDMSHYDCSCLVATFLAKAGYPMPGNMGIASRISPNDIARLLKVIS